MATNIKAYTVEKYKTIINGKVIADDEIKANYDGKNLTLDILNNGKHYHKILPNNTIEQILLKPAHSLPLEERLLRDFGMGMGKGKSKKEKKVKKSKGKKTLKRKKNKSRKRK